MPIGNSSVPSPKPISAKAVLKAAAAATARTSVTNVEELSVPATNALEQKNASEDESDIIDYAPAINSDDEDYLPPENTITFDAVVGEVPKRESDQILIDSDSEDDEPVITSEYVYVLFEN